MTNEPYNVAIVTATLNTGQCHSQLKQFSAILDMPCMSNKKYQKEHAFEADKTEISAWESIELARKEKARLVVEHGDITVYKHNYNTSSGVVCLIFFKLCA